MEVIIYFTDFNLFDNLKFKTFNVELLLKALEAFDRRLTLSLQASSFFSPLHALSFKHAA